MKTKIIFFQIILILSLYNLNAQWVQTNGPYEGRVNCLERVNNKIWAGTNIGIFESSNNGINWQKLQILPLYISSILNVNDTIVILYVQKNLQFPDEIDWLINTSFDNGSTWNNPVLVETTDNNVYPLELKYLQSTFFIKGNIGFYISNNYGMSWSSDPFLSGSYIESFMISGSNILMSTQNDTIPYSRYYLSQNNAQTWNYIYGTNNGGVCSYFKDSIILMFVTSYDTINHNYLVGSKNLGNTWDTTITLSPGCNSFGLTYSINDNIYTAMCNQNYLSSDKGQTWQTVDSVPPFPNYSYFDTICLSNGDYLSAHPLNGVLYNFNNIDSFVYLNNGINGALVDLFREHNGVLFANTINGLNYSSDLGQSWQKSNIPTSNELKDILFEGDTMIVIANNYLERSFDNGITWDSIHAPYQYSMNYYQCLQKLGNRLFLSADSIFYSDNLGQSWNTLPPIPIIIDSINGINNYDITGNIKIFNSELFVVTNSGYIFKYDQFNNGWIYLSICYSYGANNYNFLYSLNNTLVMSGRTGFFVSNDYGHTWITNPINGLPVSEYDGTLYPSSLISYNGVWIGMCGELGVYCSSDHGYNWQLLGNDTIPFKTYGGIAELNGIIYSGSKYKSVWHRANPINIISGTVYYDLNNNGIKDAGEQGLSNIILKLITNNTVASTDSSGKYSIYLNIVNDTLKPFMPIALATSLPMYYLSNGAAQNIDFGINIPTNIADLTIDLTNINVFRPGFQTILKMSVENRGSSIQSGNIVLVLDTNLQYNSAIPLPNYISGDTLFWTTQNLNFMETYPVSVTVSIPVTDTIGGSIHCIASVSPFINDINPTDNHDTLNNFVVGSYDPNDKQCLQGNYFTPEQVANNNELEFIVRFQNTGNYQADFIHVIDTLNSFFDLSTFRVLSSSHPLNWSISGNGIIDFSFNPINLPPLVQDELNSHGYVKYSIKCKSGVVLGDAITNTAYIYFDYNSAIITNTTTTLIANPIPLNVSDMSLQNKSTMGISIYPNPTSDKLYVNIEESNKMLLSLNLYSITGSLIKQVRLNSISNIINLNNIDDGLYFGMIMNLNNESIATFKIIKSK